MRSTDPPSARVRTLDAHVAGGAVRVIVSGVAPVAAPTLAARRDALARRHDGLRRALLMPPRGGTDTIGALLTEPVTPGADAGVLFLDGSGWPSFSGHGLVGVVTLAIERGLATRGHDRWARLVIDTLAGPVPVAVEVAPAGEAAGGVAPARVTRVAYESPPARVLAGGLPVSLPGRTLRVDLVSCAGLFAIADSESAGVPLDSDALPELRRAATQLSGAVEADARRISRDRPPDEQVSVVFIGPSDDASADVRSATVMPGGRVSLSPSGRATAAIGAVLDAMGMLPGDRPFTNEGLLGLTLEGRVVGRSPDDPPILTVEVAGTAWPTGDHEFVFCAGDPATPGLRVRG